MKLVNPDDPPAPMDDAAQAAVSALAARQKAAHTLVMRAVTFLGGQVEDGLKIIPKGLRDQIEAAARLALLQSYHLAARSQTLGPLRRIASDRGHRLMAALSGAAGGAGGLPTALAELPLATTIIFRAVQRIAAEYGEDPQAATTRMEILRVFGAGGPEAGDDGIDTTFIGARLSLTGAALNTLVTQVASRFGLVIGQKLAMQAVPVLGAAAGAGTNWAFVRYYSEIAHVHFGLRRLQRIHGDEDVLQRFHAELARLQQPVLRS